MVLVKVWSENYIVTPFEMEELSMNRCRLFLFIHVMAILAVVANPIPMRLSAETSYLPLILKAPPPGVQILPNYSHYVDINDYLHVVGEISNNTPNNLRSARISANFFNDSGQFIDTDYAFTFLYDLPAYDKTCFDIWFPKPNGWSTFEFDPLSYYTDGNPLTKLILLNTSGSYEALTGFYRIIGQVRNDYGNRIEYVMPVATLYNTLGSVVGCKFGFVDSTHLDPNQTSPFTIIALGRDYSDVSTYKLQVNGVPK
jgi:hypothetical protein